MKPCALKQRGETLRTVRLMVAEPPYGLTDKPYKPLCGAFVRKAKVLSDREKVGITCQVRFSELNESELSD